MKVIEQYEENGYIIKKYENGSVEKIIISSEEINNQQEDKDIDYNIAKINTDLEYIKCILEE